MRKLEQFKDFVRQYPFIKSAVDHKKITWQKAYETYDLFGEQASDWEALRQSVETPPTPSVQPAPAPMPQTATQLTATPPIDWIGLLTRLDFNQISTTIDQLQRILGVVGTMSKPEEVKDSKTRKAFKRFND